MKLGMTITGGGTGVIPMLLQHGGASEWFSFADIPYSKEASDEIWFIKPEKYSSKVASDQLAIHALEKLQRYHPDEDNLKVLACSAALFKENQREGRENKASITFIDYYRDGDFGKKINIIYEFLNKDKNSRIYQEMILSDILLAIAKENYTNLQNIDQWISYKYDLTPIAKLVYLDWTWK